LLLDWPQTADPFMGLEERAAQFLKLPELSDVAFRLRTEAGVVKASLMVLP